VAITISSKQKLGLTKDIIGSVIRTVTQLTVVGYLLYYIFDLNHVILTLAMVMIIIYNASRQANKRNPNGKKKFIQSLVIVTLVFVLHLPRGSLYFLENP